MAVANLIKFAVWSILPGEQLQYNERMVCFREKAMELSTCEKLFSFFLSMYSWLSTPVFLAVRHTTTHYHVY